MLAKLITLVAAWIMGVISTMGYGGIVLLMAIESACIPLPSEIIMPFAGYLVSTGRFDLYLAATAGAILYLTPVFSTILAVTLLHRKGYLTQGRGRQAMGVIDCSCKSGLKEFRHVCKLL